MKIRTILVCGLMMSTQLFAAKLPVPNLEARAPEGPRIKVLLAKDIPSALLEVKGNYNVIRKDSGDILSFGTQGKRFVIHALQDGLRWGEEYPDVYQITVIPSPESYTYVDGIQYKGAISVYHVRDNRITIVNEVPIEEYLKSTLTLKYDAPLSIEAAAALAIVSRTEAYSCALSGQTTTRPWDVVAEQVDYFGSGVTKQTASIEDAVSHTRFMVMESAKDGRPMQNIRILPSKAEELARSGYDAKRIILSSYPSSKIGATIKAEEVALR